MAVVILERGEPKRTIKRANEVCLRCWTERRRHTKRNGNACVMFIDETNRGSWR